MMTLDEFAPSEIERNMVAGMPEQVAIGYLRAMRKANGGKGVLFPPDHERPTAGDLFGGLFKKPGTGS